MENARSTGVAGILQPPHADEERPSLDARSEGRPGHPATALSFWLAHITPMRTAARNRGGEPLLQTWSFILAARLLRRISWGAYIRSLLPSCQEGVRST